MTEPTRTVRWGILSTAQIATKLCRAIELAEGAEVAAVASRDPDRAAQWAKDHGVPRSVGNYEQLLQDPEVDAVYIPLPPSMHATWTMRAAEHGKHVLCEKPLAGTAAEAAEMADCCRQHGVQLMDGVMWVHHFRTEQMRGHIERGELGDLRRVTSAFSFRWDPWPTDDIRLQRDLAGGSLLDLGYYCVRASLWAFGGLPERVFGSGLFTHDVDLRFSGLMWFCGERVASFDCAFDTGGRKWFEVAGARQSLVCDDFTLPKNEEHARYWLHDSDGNSHQQSTGRCIQEVRMIEHFSGIVRTGRLEERWPSEALDTMSVCDALAASARSGTVVDVRR